MKKATITLLLILIGLSSLSVKAQKEVTVRLNPKAGVTYNTTIKNTMMNLMEVQGQNMTSTQSIENKCSFKTKSIDKNGITFEGQNDAIKLSISQMGMMLTYDSEHPEKTSPMLAGQVDELADDLKKPYTIMYDVLGHHIESEEDPETSQISSAIIELPEEPLKVGSTWTNTKKQEINGTAINATLNYTVTKISKKSVEVDVNGTVEGSYDTSGTYEGTASIDVRTGLIIKSTIKQNISMTLSEQGMTIPMTMNGTTTVTVE